MKQERRRRLAALMCVDVLSYESQQYEDSAFALGGDDHGMSEAVVDVAKERLW